MRIFAIQAKSVTHTLVCMFTVGLVKSFLTLFWFVECNLTFAQSHNRLFYKKVKNRRLRKEKKKEKKRKKQKTEKKKENKIKIRMKKRKIYFYFTSTLFYLCGGCWCEMRLGMLIVTVHVNRECWILMTTEKRGKNICIYHIKQKRKKRTENKIK